MATRLVKPMVQDGFEYREMTDAEFEQYKIDQIEAAQTVVNAETKQKEKQAILDRLGLSVDDLTILLS